MSAEQIIKDIRQKNFKPIYFLMGEEPYFIDMIADALEENVLDEGEKEFNQTILYGKDTDPQTIIDIARQYPMMAEYQVIFVKEAQNIRSIGTVFEKYFENPVSTTILVFLHKYKNLDKRTKAVKLIKEKGVLFQSDKLKEYKIPDWVMKQVKARKLNITEKAAQLLVEFLGDDLSKITNELDKLAIVLKEGTTINDDIIEKNIGISKDYNIFELTNAMRDMDKVKAQQIVQYFAQNPKAVHITMVVASVFGFFEKLMTIHFLPQKDQSSVASNLRVHPFVAKQLLIASKRYPPKKIAANISILREFDLKSKGYGNTSTTDGELMRELIFRLMH